MGVKTQDGENTTYGSCQWEKQVKSYLRNVENCLFLPSVFAKHLPSLVSKWPITIQHDELFDRSTRHQKNIEKDALNSDFSGPRRLLRGNDISFKIGSNRKS